MQKKINYKRVIQYVFNYIIVCWLIVVYLSHCGINNSIHELNTQYSTEIKLLKQANIELLNKLQLLENLMYTVQTNALVTLTHYSADTYQTDNTPTITAFMVKVRIGYIAVSRDLFKRGWTPGRKVYIEGKGVYIIADLMNKRKGNWVDIFTNSDSDAKKAGIERGVVATLFLENGFIK